MVTNDRSSQGSQASFEPDSKTLLSLTIHRTPPRSAAHQEGLSFLQLPRTHGARRETGKREVGHQRSSCGKL